MKDSHEAECEDVTWGREKDYINLYDHSYTNDQVLPDFCESRHSTWHYINEVEHNYCGPVQNVNINSK